MGGPTVGIWVHGFTGRMGRALVRLLSKHADARLEGVIELRDSGVNKGMVESDIPRVIHEAPEKSTDTQVVVDFSHPSALKPLVRILSGTGMPLVCGTTGLDKAEKDLLEEYSKESPVFYDHNMSYGISILRKLLRVAGPALTPTCDVEVVEFHHRGKADFPSGTAYALANEVAPHRPAQSGRGDFARPASDRIHIHSVRLGGVPGVHEVHFADDEEVVTLSHRALSRDAFARGAIRAARFLAGQKRPGLFSMDDLAGDPYG